jgi:hypothetical protein
LRWRRRASSLLAYCSRERVTFWPEEEIDAWLENKRAARDEATDILYGWGRIRHLDKDREALHAITAALFPPYDQKEVPGALKNICRRSLTRLPPMWR